MISTLFKKVKKNISLLSFAVASTIVWAGIFAYGALNQTSSFIMNSTPQPAPNGSAPVPLFVLSFPYGTTNWSTNQTVTNNGSAASGSLSSNGWIYYQLVSGVTPSPIVGSLSGIVLVTNNPYIDPVAWASQTNIITQVNGGISLTSPTSVTNTVYWQKCAGMTNANGVATVAPLSDCALFADANGDISTNAQLLLRANADAMLGAGSNMPVLNVVFARVNSRYNLVDTNNLYTFTVPLAGTNVAVSFNGIPVGLNNGCDKIRLWGVYMATNGVGSNYTGTNVYLQVAALDKWNP